MEVWTPYNKHTVRVGHSPGATTGNVGDVAPEVPAMYNPCLAYERDVLDPLVDADRDEGLARLKLLRPALFMAKKGWPSIIQMEAGDSLAATITGSEALRFAVHAAFFKDDAAWRPKIRLIAPTTKTFGAETADAKLPEQLRVECVPVKGTDKVCALNWPNHMLPTPKVLIDFSKRQLNQKEAFMQIKRGEAPETLACIVFSDSGTRQEFTLTEVKGPVIDRLFAPLPMAKIVKPLPQLPGELPTDVQSAVADFWQHQMRGHVAATVCAPEDATRPLAFESIKVTREGYNKPERLVLRGAVHASSIKCACRLHKLKPMQERFPSERFEGSEVDMTLSMCGRKRPKTDAGYGDCPLHGANTPNVAMFPGICCHDTVAQMGCTHFVSAGKQKRSRRKSGLWIPDMGLEGHDLLHAQGLMAAASAAAGKLTPMLGVAPKAEVMDVCERAEKLVERNVDEVTRKRVADGSVRSDKDMITLDMAAVDALRSGKYRRHLTSTRQEVLAYDLPEGGVSKCTKLDADKGKGPPLELAETHIGLFRPPLPRSRRATQ